MELAQESGKGGGQMEQTLVVYSSETGFTQRFALCIAQTLHCEMIDVQFLTASDLKNRSLVIYGGHLVGNKVLGLKSFYRQFKEDLPEQFIVFGSGVVRRESVNCQQIAQYQQRRFGLSYDPANEIIVTVGGSEAIDLALRALVEPGDEVIVPEPCFV